MLLGSNGGRQQRRTWCGGVCRARQRQLRGSGDDGTSADSNHEGGEGVRDRGDRGSGPAGSRVKLVVVEAIQVEGMEAARAEIADAIQAMDRYATEAAIMEVV